MAAVIIRVVIDTAAAADIVGFAAGGTADIGIVVCSHAPDSTEAQQYHPIFAASYLAANSGIATDYDMLEDGQAGSTTW